MTAIVAVEPETHDHTARAVQTIAAWSAAAAATAHAAVVPQHLVEWPAAGVFFLALAIGQAMLACALYIGRPGPRTLVAAAWANIGVIVFYVISRTAGVPFAPADHVHGGHSIPGSEALPEAVGGADMIALVGELTLVALMITMLPPKLSRRTSTLLMLAGVSLWTSSALGLLG